MKSMTRYGTTFCCKKVNSKSRKFTFHHEITTDGVAVSMLLSRLKPLTPKTFDIPDRRDPMDDCYLGRQVGIDPGGKNLRQTKME